MISWFFKRLRQFNTPKQLNRSTAMGKFSPNSKEQLATCDERLQRVFTEVIKHYDCSILCGHRSKAGQTQVYNDGLSKRKWPFSKHNPYPSEAVDVIPYPVDWKDTKRFYHFIGFVLGTAQQMGIKLRSGSDWDQDNDLTDQKFIDLPHFELVD